MSSLKPILVVRAQIHLRRKLKILRQIGVITELIRRPPIPKKKQIDSFVWTCTYTRNPPSAARHALSLHVKHCQAMAHESFDQLCHLEYVSFRKYITQGWNQDLPLYQELQFPDKTVLSKNRSIYSMKSSAAPSDTTIVLRPFVCIFLNTFAIYVTTVSIVNGNVPESPKQFGPVEKNRFGNKGGAIPK
jgi:hypothetical protein